MRTTRAKVLEMPESASLSLIGFDPDRPPKIQRRPCIDLFFQLNEPACEDWCKCFLAGVGKQAYSVKIDPEIGEFVETWVRTPQEIERSLALAKDLVKKGNESYLHFLEEKRKKTAVALPEETISPEQEALNKVVAALSFDI